MLILEYKLRLNQTQRAAIEEAIRTVQFIRNKGLRLWMDGRGVSAFDLNVYSTQLANVYPFAGRLNSMARQASAERAAFAVGRFYDNCQQHKPGKKGYPPFQTDNRSVEYKTSGWKVEPDGKRITFTDGMGIGTVRLIGTRKQHIETFPIEQIKRVRLLKRADGYYVQFVLKAERQIAHQTTGKQIGIDMGLKSFSTDSEGATVANPRFLRKAETKLRCLPRRKDRKTKGSANRKKAIKRLARGYLKVSRQRKDFAAKAASALVSSHDLIAYEALQIHNMVKNHHLAKSSSDAAWGLFLGWVRYYGGLHGIPIVAVSPRFTSQDCSGCGERVQKSLSVRTHVCPRCGLVLDRDQNAALNILEAALCTAGQAETGTLRSAKRLGRDGPLPAAGRTGKSASRNQESHPPLGDRECQILLPGRTVEGRMFMTVSVCPAAIVAAPLEEVWALLMQPEAYDLWWDAHTEWIVSEGPAKPGQVISAWTSAFGRRWKVRAEIEQIDVEKHQIDFTTMLPLGIQGHNHLSCAPLDERSCRLQFG